MRELVYLSEAKLAQFLPQKPPWWARLGRNARVEVSTPVGSVDLYAGEPMAKPTTAHLQAVIAKIETEAKWLNDPEVCPGQWVQFEMPMNYIIVSSVNLPGRGLRSVIVEGETGPLLFLDSNDTQARGPRLLLHGSARHLLGHNTRPDQVELQTEYNSGDRFLLQFLRSSVRDPLKDGGDGHPHPGIALRSLVRHLDERMGRETASWMAGYARVTMRVGGAIGATPLYVERVSPP